MWTDRLFTFCSLFWLQILICVTARNIYFIHNFLLILENLKNRSDIELQTPKIALGSSVQKAVLPKHDELPGKPLYRSCVHSTRYVHHMASKGNVLVQLTKIFVECFTYTLF